jgi:PTS system nitrogen regulatory IIA component
VARKDLHCESEEEELYSAIDLLADHARRRCYASRTSCNEKRVDLPQTHEPSRQVLSPSHVVADLQASSKKRLFEQAGLLFENHDKIGRSVVFDSLFAREKLGSTGLGQGVAIPHGRIKGLKEALGAFLRLAQPVPFESPDSQPVSLAFVLLVPEKAPRSTCRSSPSWRRCSAIARCAKRC